MFMHDVQEIAEKALPWASLVSLAAYFADKFYSISYTLSLVSLTSVVRMLTDHNPTCTRGLNLSLPGVFLTLHMDAK